MRSILVLLLALGLLPTAQALPTPGVFCEVGDAAFGRVFPEAMQVNDFISYDEARCGLDLLMSENPDWMKLDVVGESVGWPVVTGGHDTFEVFVVRVSHYAAPMPVEDRIRLVFQLSIHGNEKGGREGGLRVIEDLVRDMGVAREQPHMREMLDFMELLFVFPNPDGWTHEEASYRHNDACYFSTSNLLPGQVRPECGEGVETQSFVRVNGHGVDVNREWPTIGWQREAYTALSEPEAIGLVEYLLRETRIKYASDIHGMLNPADGQPLGNDCGAGQVPPDVMGFDPTCFADAVPGAKGHYILTMLPAGRQSPAEVAANTALAETLKQRLNGDPHFAEWRSVPNSLGGAWGGEFNDWGTVWDTLGYTDSGFTSDWYAQDSGLNVPGVDFELAYNHVTFDNYYPGLAQRMNDYHVRVVRIIVWTFMEQAAQDLAFQVDAAGTRTAYVANPTLVTNAGDLRVAHWGLENDADDAYDTAHRVFHAAPGDYFDDVRASLAPGSVLDRLTPDQLNADALAGYDNLVLAGGAYRTLQDDADALAALRAWVEAGGNLVVTDEGLHILPAWGLAEKADVYHDYAGFTSFRDRDHELVADVRGLARQTYEPVPLGFALNGEAAVTDEGSSPIWFLEGYEGEVVGVADGGRVNFGRTGLGEGRIVFLGAFLPDPTRTDQTYYGVDGYATTYTGNQLLRNALGWKTTLSAEPVDPETLGAAAIEEERDAPGIGLMLVLGGIALVAALRRR